jgi:hypothetical protein
MKTNVCLALSLLLAGCDSASVKPDPRVAVIHRQHEQLLAKQKEYNAQLNTLTGNEKLSASHIAHSKQRFAEIIEQSQANLNALDQLDPAKSQDPAQVALVGEIAAKEASIYARGQNRLETIHNEHYVPR